MEKYGAARQDIHDDMTLPKKCDLLTGFVRQEYRQTIRMCNTYGSSTATMVTRGRLDVSSHVHCLSCLILHLCLYPTPGVARRSALLSLGHGSKSLRNILLFDSGLLLKKFEKRYFI